MPFARQVSVEMRAVVPTGERADNPPPPRKTRVLRDCEIAGEAVRVEAAGVRAYAGHLPSSLSYGYCVMNSEYGRLAMNFSQNSCHAGSLWFLRQRQISIRFS